MADDADKSFPVLISLHLKMQSSPNRTVDVVAEIGHPYWTSPGVEAACPVAIRGTVGRVNDIRGIDLMSAVKQSIIFIESYLDEPVEGQKFFWPNGEEY